MWRTTGTVREERGLLIHCAPAAIAEPGALVAVAIRPEKIVPANGAVAAPNVVDATLVRRTYLGDLVQYHVLVPGGRELTLQRQNDPSDVAAGWDIGERVRVMWHPDSALLLEADATAID